MMTSKREITLKTGNSAENNGLIDSHRIQRKEDTPHMEVTVDFAAKQLFQILLIDIKRRNAKFSELIPGAILA